MNIFTKSPKASIWNVSNGKIIHQIMIDDSEIILECFSNGFVLILSKNIHSNNTEFDLILRKFSVKFQVV